MHRDTDRAGLIGHRTGDRLPDPPGGVGGELVALLVVELLDCTNQAQVALLDQVQEQHAAAGVALGQGDDESQVRFEQVVLGAPADDDQLLQLVLLVALEFLDECLVGQLLLGEESRLDPLGEHDLLLGVQQGNLADLLEVVLHRVGRGTRDGDRLHRFIGVVIVRQHEPFSARRLLLGRLGLAVLGLERCQVLLQVRFHLGFDLGCCVHVDVVGGNVGEFRGVLGHRLLGRGLGGRLSGRSGLGRGGRALGCRRLGCCGLGGGGLGRSRLAGGSLRGSRLGGSSLGGRLHGRGPLGGGRGIGGRPVGSGRGRRLGRLGSGLLDSGRLGSQRSSSWRYTKGPCQVFTDLDGLGRRSTTDIVVTVRGPVDPTPCAAASYPWCNATT